MLVPLGGAELKHYKSLSRPGLWATFSDVFLVKMELRSNDIRNKTMTKESKQMKTKAFCVGAEKRHFEWLHKDLFLNVFMPFFV